MHFSFWAHGPNKSFFNWITVSTLFFFVPHFFVILYTIVKKLISAVLLPQNSYTFLSHMFPTLCTVFKHCLSTVCPFRSTYACDWLTIDWSPSWYLSPILTPLVNPDHKFNFDHLSNVGDWSKGFHGQNQPVRLKSKKLACGIICYPIG